MHFAAHVPPQSTSPSLPFFTPSLHVAAWQTPDVQTPDVQCVVEVHGSPGAPVQLAAFVVVELVPAGHDVHWRSLVAVPAAETYWPGRQFVQAAHAVAEF